MTSRVATGRVLSYRIQIDSLQNLHRRIQPHRLVGSPPGVESGLHRVSVDVIPAEPLGGLHLRRRSPGRVLQPFLGLTLAGHGLQVQRLHPQEVDRPSRVLLRGPTPHGARRYAYDVRWWEALLEGRSPSGQPDGCTPKARSPSGPGEPGTPKAIKELLGHASIATTQVYAHTSYRGLQEAAERLG